MDKDQKRRSYRHSVDLAGISLTPLVSIQCFLGEEQVKILNVSMGGFALVFEREKSFEVGDAVDLSISIRGRAFPVRVEVKASQGLRFSCELLDPSAAFLNSLKEYLEPKGIGESLLLRAELNDSAEALELLSNAVTYRSYAGMQSTAVFVWSDKQKHILRFLCVSKSKFVDWTQSSGLKTGVVLDEQKEDLQYHQEPDVMTVQFFADILLSWLSDESGLVFVTALLSEKTEGGELCFPQASLN